MPVPSSMRDLSTVAGSNSPPGSEAVGTSLDDYLRMIQSIIRATYAIGADVAAAATVDLNAFDAEAVRITGTATITSLGTCPAGFKRTLRFAGACTLTHSASLILPGGVNYVTAADDVLTFLSLGSGTWIATSASSAKGFVTLTGNQTIAGTKTFSEGLIDAIGNARDIPLNTQNAAYTFALTDRGRGVIKTNTTAYTWTIPLESTTAFPDGSAITLINDGATANISVSPAGGVTLLDGAISGGVTLLPNTVRTLIKVGTNRWRIV